MKRHIILIMLLLLTVITYAQDSAEHQIINIIDAGRVEINIGEQFDVKPEDVFQVFGRGQIIHPATGSLMERDNVYLGKIKVIDVRALSSIAETIEQRGDFSVGNKIIKVAGVEREIVEQKQPLQKEFESPRDRPSYSESIYAEKEDKTRENKKLHIVKFEQKEDSLLAILNQGNTQRIKHNRYYQILTQETDTSSFTGNVRLLGYHTVGHLHIISVEHDVSIGYTVLDEKYNNNLNHILTYNKLRRYRIPLPDGEFITYNFSGTSAFGLSYGSIKKTGWGYYGRLMSNFSFKNSEYSIDDNGLIENYDISGGYYVLTDKTKRIRLGITAGLLRSLGSFTYIYGGTGYGSRVLLWNIESYSYKNDIMINEEWVKYPNRSFSGIEVESGLMFRFKKFALSFGVSSIDFNFFELNCGMGLFLN